jgi:hypothetical protein
MEKIYIKWYVILVQLSAPVKLTSFEVYFTRSCSCALRNSGEKNPASRLIHNDDPAILEEISFAAQLTQHLCVRLADHDIGPGRA